MDSNETLDRELIVERAEALRGWLAGFGLSGRAASAFERELEGIIANDPGAYINGQRPLAGLTVDDFVGELHRRNAGAVGRVKSVGDSILKELRAAIPPDTAVAAPARPPAEAPAGEAAAADPAPAKRRAGRPRGASSRARNGATDVPAPAEAPAEAPTAEAPAAEAPAAPRRRGRPKGSTAAARNGAAPSSATAGDAEPTAVAETAAPPAAEATASEEPPRRRRGRPRRDAAQQLAGAERARPAAPARPAPAAPEAQSAGDVAFDQLARLWPALHPHGRRAVVLYASELLAEAGRKG